MAVHNEEKYIPYGVGNLARCSFDELICVLDRCSDQSEELIREYAESANWELRIIELKKRFFNYPTAEVFYTGFQASEGNVIYALAPDCIYHPGIFEIDWSDVDLASFPIRDYPLFNSFLEKLRVHYSQLHRHRNFTGAMGFKRNLLYDFEDVIAEDKLIFYKSRCKGFNYRFYPGYVNVHIRPFSETWKLRHRETGFLRAKSSYPFWKMFLESFLNLSFERFRSFIRNL